jgi:hypothetical protein
VTEREGAKLFAPTNEEVIRGDNQRACSQLGQACKDRIEIALAARMQDMEPKPEGVGRRRRSRLNGYGPDCTGRRELCRRANRTLM